MGSRATTIQDSGSEPSSAQSSVGSRTANFEDFVVLRRNQIGRGERPRAVSEIITSNSYKNTKRESGWFEALKQSLFGGNCPASLDAVQSKSTFYVDNSDEKDDECYYSSLDLPDPISSRVKKTLPESVVNNLTPAVFEIPKPNPSVFYTDQEEHIYSSSDTLGSLSYPGLAVHNEGYRDPHLQAAEQLEQSIPVRPGYQELVSSHSRTVQDPASPRTVPVAASSRTFQGPKSSVNARSMDALASTRSDGNKSGTVARSPDMLLNSKPSVGTGAVIRETEPIVNEGGIAKRKVSRVSMMKQKFENPDFVENSSEDENTSITNKTGTNIHEVRKQIVSLQFSSNILEIDHKENSPSSREK